MIGVHNVSRHVAQSGVHKVIDVVDEFMLNETDNGLDDISDSPSNDSFEAIDGVADRRI